MGKSPITGWFVSGKIPSFELDDDWGYPYFRKPPYDCWDGYWLFSLLKLDVMKKKTNNDIDNGKIV